MRRRLIGGHGRQSQIRDSLQSPERTIFEMTNKNLQILLEQGILAPIDVYFADLMADLSGEGNAELLLAAALVSSATREGHICLDMNATAGASLGEAEAGGAVICPDPESWFDAIKGQAVVGSPGEFTPLVLDQQGRLYLYRYWEYEEELASGIRDRTRKELETDFQWLKEALDRYFPKTDSGEIDWQKVAAFTALVRGFCIISGGPGTGKTTTVAKILALLIEQARSGALRVGLAAPTGKGAARLEEAIRGGVEGLDCGPAIRDAFPREASTLHRLLGSLPGTPYFRYNADRPLPMDVVVVDEASMVDMAMMSKLVQAIPAGGRLILLGDKDQLASVEAGAVLGDLCDRGRPHGFSKSFAGLVSEMLGMEMGGGDPDPSENGIEDAMVELKKNYRFGRESGIYALSRAVNEGRGEQAVTLLRSGRFEDIGWRDPVGGGFPGGFFREELLKGFRDCFMGRDPLEIFRSFERFRLLCALREGPYGIHALNRAVEHILSREGLIKRDPGGDYAGRPVLVTRNDYSLGLFNGDMGVLWPDPGAGGDLRAFFPDPAGGLRRFHPRVLPEHETVYAMTVHKSQGSEFDRVILILPDRDSPLLTRELLYTGITRARRSVEVWGPEKIFAIAASRSIERSSGLRDALWRSHRGGCLVQ